MADLRAFDTGPGNMVLDEIVRDATRGKRAYDAGGRWARRGTVNRRLLAELMAHPFLTRRPPKSTGREEFGELFVRSLIAKQRKGQLSIEDLLATCATWTATAIGSSRRWVSGDIHDVIVGGGGVYNRTIMESLRQVFEPVPVVTFDECGWSSKAFEATAFALLAHDMIHGQCTNVPQVTGARRPVLLGSVVPGGSGAPRTWQRHAR